jgi:CheY-like chemotaxis protein
MQKILFVDDEDHISKAYRKSLERRGFSVDFCDKPDTALLKLSEVFDAIVLDLMMPTGSLNPLETLEGFVTGLAILKRFRQRGSYCPAFVLTQMPEERIKRHLLDSSLNCDVFGNISYYHKSLCRPGEFADILSRQLAKVRRA